MTWTRRGGTSLEQTGSGSSISVSYTPLAGSLIVVSVSWGTGTATDFSSVSDGTNTYTIPTGGRFGDSGNGQGGGVAYAVAASGAALTIQANFATACTFRVITVDEYTCTTTWAPFDTLVSANPTVSTGGTDVISAGSLTTATANELLHGFCVCSSALSVNLTVGTGFTLGTLQNTGGLTTATASQNVVSAGSVATTFSTTAAPNTWIVFGVAFKESGGGGGGPTITSTSSATPSNGSSLTINASGGGFGASQGAGTVTIGGITQTVTSWSDTSITVTVDRGTNKYGTTVNVVVQPNTGSPSNSYALTSLQPQSGWAYVDVGTPAADPFTRLTAQPDYVSGDQIAYDTRGGLVSVASDLTFSASPQVYSWQYEAWSTGSGWSPLATQTMYVARLADGGQDAELAALLRRLRKPAQLALDPSSWGGAPLDTAKWFAPELGAQAAAGTTLTPSQASLSLATYAPTLSQTANQTLTPGAAALSLATFAATVQQPQVLTPGAAALSLAAFAPSISQPVALTPGVAALTLATFAPTVTQSAASTLVPGAAALTLATFAPTLLQPQTVTPGVAALSLATFAPSVAQTAASTLVPGVASIGVATFAPTLLQPQTVTPGVAALALTTYAPTVAQTAASTLVPGAAALSVATYAPTVLQPRTLTPGAAALSLASFAPSVTQSASATLVPGVAALSLATFAPVVVQPRIVTAGVLALNVATYAPTVSVVVGVPPTWPAGGPFRIGGTPLSSDNARRIGGTPLKATTTRIG